MLKSDIKKSALEGKTVIAIKGDHDFQYRFAGIKRYALSAPTKVEEPCTPHDGVDAATSRAWTQPDKPVSPRSPSSPTLNGLLWSLPFEERKSVLDQQSKAIKTTEVNIKITEAEELEEDSFNTASAKAVNAVAGTHEQQDVAKSPRKSMLNMASDAITTRVSALSVRHKKAVSPAKTTPVDEFPGSTTTRSIGLLQLEDDLTKAAQRCSMMKKLNNDANLILPDVFEIEPSEVLMDNCVVSPTHLLFEESKKNIDASFDDKYFERQVTSFDDKYLNR